MASYAKKNTSKKLPKPQIKALKAAYQACGSVFAAARQCGISHFMARKYLEGTKVPLKHQAANTPPEKPEERERRLREMAKERDLIKSIAGEKSLRAYLGETIEAGLKRLPPPPPYKPMKPKPHVSEETMLLHLSDWHAYEIVNSESVMGLNSYNASIMAARVWRVINTCLDIKTRLKELSHFPRLVVALNGDFISGTIHEIEKHCDAPNVVMAALGTGMILGQALRDLAANFQDVQIVGTVGNHGRLPDHRKVPTKDPTRNWDYLIYQVAKQALSGLANITWTLPESYAARYAIEDHHFYQGHGHFIKSWMGIPFYGINRMASNLNAVFARAGKPVNYWLFGHFHNPASCASAGGEYFVNGSLIGCQEFGLHGQGWANPPSQWMMGVHKRNGVTHRWPLMADVDDGVEGTYQAYPWEDQAA